MRLRFVASLATLLAAGCATSVPDTPRLTSGFQTTPTVQEQRAAMERLPLSAAFYLAPDAAASRAVEQNQIYEQVLDYGPLGPHLASAIAAHAERAFDRVFVTRSFPNPELWKEGVDLVVAIESARANKIYVDWPERPVKPKKLIGWEVVLVLGVYSIDGRPLGHHEGSPSRGLYRVSALQPIGPIAFPEPALDAEVKRKHDACRPGETDVACQVAFTAGDVARLHYAVVAALVKALREFPRYDALTYLRRYRAAVDADYGRYLARKDDAAYLRSLRDATRSAVASLTPALPTPVIDPVSQRIAKLRESAQLAQTSAALNSLGASLHQLQAQNYANMGMTRRANTALQMSRTDQQLARSSQEDANRYLEQLAKAGVSPNENRFAGVLNLLAGVADYGTYRMQKAAGDFGQYGSSRCEELRHMREVALRAREVVRPGQQPPAHDTPGALQLVYEGYCRR